MESPQCCLEKFALGNSQGSSDFPEGHSREGKSDDPREFPRAKFSDNTEDSPVFFRLLDLNSEEYEAQSCPRFMSEHIHVNLSVSLTVLNPDFTEVIRKSE